MYCMYLVNSYMYSKVCALYKVVIIAVVWIGAEI
jgi:hypothetical protein